MKFQEPHTLTAICYDLHAKQDQICALFYYRIEPGALAALPRSGAWGR